ncbi:MAG: diguanylate cyclase [Arcobacter butzleri]|nr:diguanylate cyclase [Aliarcobacter butzleri]
MVKEILKNTTILYVEDEKTIRDNTSMVLGIATTKKIIVASDGQEAYKLFLQYQDTIDILVTDINMPFLSGLDLIEKIQQTHPELPSIITTAYNDLEYLHRAIELGVAGFVLKPLDLHKLIHTIAKALMPIILKKELIATNEELIKLNQELEEKVLQRTKELERLANIDPLTGISNRRDFFNKATSMLEDSRDKQIFAAMIDLDNFKLLNDNYGHAFGDEVLKQVTSTIGSFLDNEKQIFGRLGGEEFAIISSFSSQKEFIDKMEEIRESVSNINFDFNQKIVNTTISFGIASKEEDEDINSLLSRADHALYEAKDGGRNKVIFRSRT